MTSTIADNASTIKIAKREGALDLLDISPVLIPAMMRCIHSRPFELLAFSCHVAPLRLLYFSFSTSSCPLRSTPN